MRWPDPAQGARQPRQPHAGGPGVGAREARVRWPAACSRSPWARCRRRWSITDDGRLASAPRGARVRPAADAVAACRCPSFLADPVALERARARRRRRRAGRRAEGARAHDAVVRRGDVRARRSARWPASAWRTPAAACSRFPNTPRSGSRKAPAATRATKRDCSRAGAISAPCVKASTRSTARVDALADAGRRAGAAGPSDPLGLMARQARRAPPVATLAKFSRPRLYNVQKRERLFRLLDERRGHPDPVDRGPARRGQVDARRELHRGAQAAGPVVPGRSRRRRSRDVLPLRSHRRRRNPRQAHARRRRAAGVLRRIRGRPSGVHAPLHARAVRAVPAGLGARRRQLPRAQGRPRVALRVRRRAARDSRWDEPHLPVARAAGARRWRASSASSASRRIEWEALRFTAEESEALTVERAGRKRPRARHLQGERRLGRGHRADARAPRCATKAWRRRRSCPRARRRCSSTSPARSSAARAPENQRVLMLAALLPSVSPADAEAISGNPEAPLVLDYVFRRHLFTDRRRIGDQPVYQFHALFREFLLAEGKRRLTRRGAAGGARPRRRPARRARRLRRRRRAVHRSAGVARARRTHAARGTLAARRRPPQGARPLARRDARRTSAKRSRGWRSAKRTR